MIVVANAGLLIALAQIDRLALLHALYGKLHIPPAVTEEVVAAGPDRPGATEVSGAGWIDTIAVRDRTAVDLLADRLDPGESEAIVLALELSADLLLIDEARGRRIAEAHGLAKTGTVGTLVIAKRRGLLQAVAPELDKLQLAGFRMDESLYNTALRLAGETDRER